MLKPVWPRSAGPRKVWPLTPREAAERRREAEAEHKQRTLKAALAALISIPPFIS